MHGDAAWAFVRTRREVARERFETVEHRRILIPELEVDPGLAGDDAHRVRFERHLPDRPHRALSRRGGELAMDRVHELDHGVGGVVAPGHRSGAGVVLLAFELHGEVARPDDAGDHSDPVPFLFEIRTLLDVRLQVGDVPFGVEALRRNAVEPGRAQRFAQGQAGAVRRVGRVGWRVAHEREASEAAEEPAFLVEPRCDVDREVLRRRRPGQRPRDLESADHAHRAVEPASGRLGIGVGADDHRPAGVAGPADNVAGPVDAGIESRFLQSPAKPVPRFEVDR